jgi:hypothetical protein
VSRGAETVVGRINLLLQVGEEGLQFFDCLPLQLEGHPVVGGSWEGFVIEQLLAHLPKANAYYWRTQAGAECRPSIMMASATIRMANS